MSMDDKQSVRTGTGFSAALGAPASTGLGKGATPKTAMPVTSRLVKEEQAASALTANSGGAAVAVVNDLDEAWRRSKIKLKAIVGEDIFSSWFNSTEFERFDEGVLNVSTPTKFLKNWVQSHYSDALFDACASEFKGLDQVNILLRQPGYAQKLPQTQQSATSADRGFAEDASGYIAKTSQTAPSWPRPHAATNSGQNSGAGPFEGSPLDPRYTFENFVIGSANRLAHAAAKQVAETVLEQPLRFNPLYIHL